MGEELASLPLAALRQQRLELETAEDRVSYRRRLVHAQIDLLEAGISPASKFTVGDLVAALGDTGHGTPRRTAIRLPASDLLPELRDLSDVLGTDPDRDDPEQVSAALTLLRAAEETLTEQRRLLHERIDGATEELIGRYRADPRAALSAIPADV